MDRARVDHRPRRQPAPLTPSQAALRERPFVLGPYIVDPARDRATSTVTRERLPLALDPMVTLVMLAANAGRLTTRAEIAAVICPNAEADEDPVTDAIEALRTTFEDDPEDPWMIEVDATHEGYRLVAPIELIASDSGHWHIDDDTGELMLDELPADDTRERRPRWGRWLLVATILALLTALAVQQVRATRTGADDTPAATAPASAP